MQEQRAKLTTNLQDLQIEPAKLQELLQKVSALPTTTAGYELADIQHLTAITGRLSQELAAQQTAITAVEHEVGLDPVSDACREFIRGRALGRAEKLGIEAGTAVLALIMGGKVPAWQTAENFAQQLLCLWIGEDFSYKSPFTGKAEQETRVTVAPTPVIVAGEAGGAAGGGSYGQVGAALRSPSPINSADREHIAKLEDELAEEKRKRLQTEQQMRQMMEQLQTLKTNSQGAASQQQLTALQHQLTTLQSKINPLITKQPDAAASALGLGRSDGRQVQLSAVDLKEHNEKARVISLEHEELKEQVSALLSMVSALMHQQSQQENELERLRQSRAPRA